MANLKNTTINNTSALQLPVGTTAQRPGSPENGYMRFNSSLNIVEYYSNGVWSFLPDIVKDGLVLYLDAGNPASYPGSGTTWTDLSGNGNNGTLVNGVGYNSDNGGSLVFDYSDDYVTTTGMENLSYPNGITVSIWHYNGGGTGPYRGVVNNGTDSDRLGGFDLRYGREDYFGGSNNGTVLNWRITNSSNLGTATSLFSNINEWHNYVGTYDNQTVRVYKDGALFDSVSHSSGGQLKTTNTSTTVGWSRGTSEYLDGRLSQVLLYNRALTAQEIQQNFNATRARFGV